MTQVRRLFPGPGRVADAAAPDVRGRSHRITALVLVTDPGSGVVVAHGDRHAGFALRVDDGHLVHDYAHARSVTTTRSSSALPVDRWVTVTVDVRRTGAITLLVDDVPVAVGELPSLSSARTGYTGLDLGCDRGQPVGDYAAPARFPGRIRWVDFALADDQELDLALAFAIEEATN